MFNKDYSPEQIIKELNRCKNKNYEGCDICTRECDYTDGKNPYYDWEISECIVSLVKQNKELKQKIEEK